MVLFLLEVGSLLSFVIVYVLAGVVLHSGKRVATRMYRALVRRTRDDAETKGKTG